MSETFKLDPAHQQNQIWGARGKVMPHFFRETLTGTFCRRIELVKAVCLTDEDPPVRLSWIFTGPQGSVRIEIDSEAQLVSVNQFYHDSFGLHDDGGENLKGLGRHPERLFKQDQAPLPDNTTSIELRRGRDLHVELWVNDHRLLRQKCFLDLYRHQLKAEAGAVEGVLTPPLCREATVRIDPASGYQRFRGWGGIAGQPTYSMLSLEGRRQWWKELVENNLLVQREYPVSGRLNQAADNWDDPEVAMPHYYGDNFPNGENSNFAYNRAIQELGGEVWFEMWEFPAWMGTTGDDPDEPGSNPIDAELYANAMASFCRAHREATGTGPAIVGLQNERAQQPKVQTAMIRQLRAKLDEAGFQTTKLHMANAPGLRRREEFMASHRMEEEAWDLIDYAASNMYDVQGHFEDTDGFHATMEDFATLTDHKPFLSTELSVNRPEYQHEGYPIALVAAQFLHDNLTVMNAEAVCWCWTLVDVEQPCYGATRSLYRVDWGQGGMPVPGGCIQRVFTAYARYIRKDMRRLDVNCEDPDLRVTAWITEQGQRTVTFLNRGQTDCRVELGGWSQLPRWELTSSTSVHAVTEWDVGGDITVPAGAILVGTDLEPLILPDTFQVP